ncbi:hypothetical protein DUNSADRAFT_4373 [Dunaliella salina]|uniref:Encoded protein n=1 Tax=Dunaliella salina TaxID=3046 RepID=A0ABQ7GS62_DUNSA|nr:hypothetical protein DUNSADRAFT_4373 [Dunaliella salina]|eukprot:KAF5837457.1 hypothetical protein DUNSADRAFT_4373 [Dunaliella salina]
MYLRHALFALPRLSTLYLEGLEACIKERTLQPVPKRPHQFSLYQDALTRLMESTLLVWRKSKSLCWTALQRA